MDPDSFFASLDRDESEPFIPETETAPDTAADAAPAPAPEAGSAPAPAQAPAAPTSDAPAPSPSDAQPGRQAPSAQPPTGGEDRDERIPLAAHLAERRRWEARIAELEQRAHRTAQLEAELQELKQKLTQQPPQPEPDYLEDPKGYVDHKVAKAIEELKKEAGEAKQTSQQAAEQAQLTQFLTQLQSAEAAFANEHPDYQDALTHIRTVRLQQYRLMYPQATDEQLIQHLQREELVTAAQLMRMGRNPAEFAYHYAKTIGYTPRAGGAANARDGGGGTVTGGSPPGTNGAAAGGSAPPASHSQVPPDFSLSRASGQAPPDDGAPLGEDADTDAILTEAFRERFGTR